MELCRWREETARRRDRPRNWIIDDKSMFVVAERMPEAALKAGTVNASQEAGAVAKGAPL